MDKRTLARAGEVVYEFLGEPHVCAYCRDPADTVDHTVPSWFVAGNYRLIAEHTFYKVPCCRDCNARAGMRVDDTFLDRKRRIAVSLRQSQRDILRVAHWTEEEIAALGHRLKKYVESGVARRSSVYERLHNLDSYAAPEGMPLHFFVRNEPKDVSPYHSHVVRDDPYDFDEATRDEQMAVSDADLSVGQLWVPLKASTKSRVVTGLQTPRRSSVVEVSFNLVNHLSCRSKSVPKTVFINKVVPKTTFVKWIRANSATVELHSAPRGVSA